MAATDPVPPKPAPARSPLTDPRSLASSATFHVVLLLLASLAAIGVALPRRSPPPKVLHAEVGPVDTRVPAEAGGGGPSELGGTNPIESVRITADGAAPDGSARDAAADALLAEALPATPSADPERQALPGPATTGVGVLPGAGLGGGGGSGGGSGGGVGRGVGPGTEFFGARERAGSFAYVIDCSGSMIQHGALGLAKRELLASLAQLPPDARFAVVFYNLRATVLDDASGRPGLMPATEANKERVRSRLASISAMGGTDHRLALVTALELRPEVIFFLTDAEQMTREDADAIRTVAGTTRIQAIVFGDGPGLGAADPLHELATATGGSYRAIDLSAMPKARR